MSESSHSLFDFIFTFSIVWIIGCSSLFRNMNLKGMDKMKFTFVFIISYFGIYESILFHTNIYFGVG